MDFSAFQVSTSYKNQNSEQKSGLSEKKTELIQSLVFTVSDEGMD
jgi:hypothetical protein